MAEFVVASDMFGRYCEIPTGCYRKMYIYKIVSLIKSKSYCDVPVMIQAVETLHKEIIPVLLVIRCGISEDKVIRVPLSECHILEKHAHWIDERNRFDCLFKCSNCHTDFYLEEGTPEENDYNYCPNCGATMNEEKMQ